MKKLVLIGVAVVFAVVALGVAGIVYAYAQSPTPNPSPFGQYGPGMMQGGRGGMMGRGGMGRGGMMGANGQYGPMHEYMEAALAEALNMTEEDLEAELAAGKTMWQVAEAKGLSQDEFTTLMTEARAEALKQMVADGVISQEQAEWMQQHMGGMGAGRGGRFGPGGCPMQQQPGATTGTSG